MVFNKKQEKKKNLRQLIKQIRREKYDWVINAHRFFSSGLLTALSGVKRKSGFDKNPLSFFYTDKATHLITPETLENHEVDRNQKLLGFGTNKRWRPKLYPSQSDYKNTKQAKPFVCLAPASVWYTKQFPEAGWVALINALNDVFHVILIGGPADTALCERIKANAKASRIENMAGQLTFLESAALMQQAEMNFVNDSAPLHLASAVNAPVTAIFCSTVPEFGFFPLSDNAHIVQTVEKLDCRPCGLHGKSECPRGDFACANIDIQRLLRESGLIF